MAKDLIEKDLNRGPLKMFLKNWSTLEVLLLYPSFPISSRFLSQILSNWPSLHSHLSFRQIPTILPSHLSIIMLFFLASLNHQTPSRSQNKELLNWISPRHLESIQHLKHPNDSWHPLIPPRH